MQLQQGTGSWPLDPIALRCADIPVTCLAWHWDLILAAYWIKHNCGGSKSGQPPCPCCYDLRVDEQQLQQGEGQQQPVQLMKWDKSRCGTVTSHKWSQPPQRYLTLSGQEGYMLVQQYRCKGCPGACASRAQQRRSCSVVHTVAQPTATLITLGAGNSTGH